MIEALSPEQDSGAAFLARRRVAMLGDGVGVGKSAQYVRACDLARADRITVLCPPVLTPNQAAQFEQWALFGWPLKILKTGADKIPDSGVVVASYALAGTPRVRDALRARGCDVLILDESHELKDRNGARTKAVFGPGGIASSAAREWFITGTPTPNHAGEWYVFAKRCGAWTGGYWAFIDRYCVTVAGQYGKKVVGSNPDTRAELLALLSPHVLAREGIEPGRSPLTIDTIAVPGEVPTFDGVDLITLHQIAAAVDAGDWEALDGPSTSTVRRLIGAAKAPGSAEIIGHEFGAGVRKAIVFCSYHASIDIIADKLRAGGLSVGVVDGRATDKQKAAIIGDFEPSGGDLYNVCIAQWQSLNAGRTMTRAARVHLVEPAWTPDVNKQMIGRAWRRGQAMPVRASFHELPGSLDAAVARTLARKAREIELISIRS